MRSKSIMVAVVATFTLLALAGPTVVAQDADDSDGMMMASEVNVTLQEWAVVPDVLSVEAGSITFNATNAGPNDPHEMVIVKTDLPASDLPTNEDGSFDEDAEGVEVIDEIEEFDPGNTESLTVDLEPGSYVLLCNLVEEEDGELEAHYQLGMWIDFDVT